MAWRGVANVKNETPKKMFIHAHKSSSGTKCRAPRDFNKTLRNVFFVFLVPLTLMGGNS